MGTYKTNLLNALNAVPLAKDAAHGLYSSLEDVASKLKIPMPTFYLMGKAAHTNPAADGLANLANAGALAKDTIVVSEPLLKLMGSTDLTQPISQELKAALSHEMHHCANRTGLFMATQLPVFALPAIALTATYLYDRAHTKKAETKSDKSAPDLIEEFAKKVRKELPKDEPKFNFLDNVVYYGKYIAIGAAATAAGLAIARYGARHYEFAADRFAANAVGDKNAMVSAIEKIHTAAQEVIASTPERGIISRILDATISAHPSLAERVANIMR
jgi:Zn-dependent protease with chaperone function